MSIVRIIAIAILILSLGACSTGNIANNSSGNKASGSKKAIKINTNKDDHTDEWLLFIDRFSNATMDAQKKILVETNHSLTEDKSNLTERVKLAVIYTIPSSRLKDASKAQNLLQDIMQGSNLNATESALLGLLYEYVVDDNRQSQKNKDDLKKLELSQQKLEALQQKYEALDKKLNDLKNIEKTISERDSKLINKPK